MEKEASTRGPEAFQLIIFALTLFLALPPAITQTIWDPEARSVMDILNFFGGITIGALWPSCAERYNSGDAVFGFALVLINMALLLSVVCKSLL